MLAPHLSVAENIFLGREPRLPLGWVHRGRDAGTRPRIIEEHRFPLQADWRVEKLSPAGKQMVEICRAIQQGSSLLIFDEPTSSLSNTEAEEVFRIVRALRARNIGVIYITHRLEELRSIGDRVTVLRDGETVQSGELRAIFTDQLIRHMVGREVSQFTPASLSLLARNCSGFRMSRARRCSKDITFSLRAGEIVGMAGLIGAGRTELCRALFWRGCHRSGQRHVGGQACGCARLATRCAPESR